MFIYYNRYCVDLDLFYGKVKFQNFAFFLEGGGGGGWAQSRFGPESFRPGSFQSELFRP